MGRSCSAGTAQMVRLAQRHRAVVAVCRFGTPRTATNRVRRANYTANQGGDAKVVWS